MSEGSDIAVRKIADQNFEASGVCPDYPHHKWIKPITCCPTNGADCPSDAMRNIYNFDEPGMTLGAASQAPALTVENVATELPKLLAMPGYNFILGNVDATSIPEPAAISRVGIATNGERLAILAIPSTSTATYKNCANVASGHVLGKSVSLLVLGVTAAAVFGH